MNNVSLTRRLNIGNYEYWELRVEIEHPHEGRALETCETVMNKGLADLGAPAISITKKEG